jgi:hypothetical protein
MWCKFSRDAVNVGRSCWKSVTKGGQVSGVGERPGQSERMAASEATHEPVGAEATGVHQRLGVGERANVFDW